MSIIDEKYKGKYRGASDAIGELIEKRCTKMPEGAKAGDKGELVLKDLFALGAANNLDKDKLANLKTQQNDKNGPGRIRMTIGNMLRAAARRRHGLYDIDGSTKVKFKDDFYADGKAPATPTETLDGEKIVAKGAADKPAPKAVAKKAPAKKAPAKKKAA